MFHPVSTLVSSVECVYVGTNTCSFDSIFWNQLSVKVSSNNRYAVFAASRVLLDCSVHFSVRVSRVGEVQLLPLTILSLLFFVLLLSLFSSSQLRIHSGTSPSTLQSLSLPPAFSFQTLISSRFVFIVVVFTPLACWTVSVNLFEFLPAASFTCASVASLVSLCCRVVIPASVSHLSTAHSRCDEFLKLPFFHLIFNLRFNVLVLDVLERSTLTCLPCLMCVQCLTYSILF